MKDRLVPSVTQLVILLGILLDQAIAEGWVDRFSRRGAKDDNPKKPGQE